MRDAPKIDEMRWHSTAILLSNACAVHSSGKYRQQASTRQATTGFATEAGQYLATSHKIAS
eukprot:m.462009 g.462009  ORF g.462009 m.462009 type:complete len:61 (+) comp21601_c1_seq3:1102-1284(+)